MQADRRTGRQAAEKERVRERDWSSDPTSRLIGWVIQMGRLIKRQTNTRVDRDGWTLSR